MEREQIIKALEFCKGDDISLCRQCAYNIPGDPICLVKLAGDALSLIKELTEENERLRLAFVAECDLSNCTREKEIKADTVRKMQERLKAELAKYTLDSFQLFANSFIDQIAKEMLEEGK